jgi:membrane protein YqaA with SNARE-associated domain
LRRGSDVVATAGGESSAAVRSESDPVLRQLYQRVLALAASPKAPVWLAIIAFAESSFFPVPPDVVLAPMVLARPEKAYFYAAICTLASVLGGILGYAIGYFVSDFAESLLALMGHGEGLQTFRGWYAEWGLWVILIKGATPIPYKLVTIASGLAAFSFPVFVLASIATRGLRFLLVAAVLKRYGPTILPIIERRLYETTALVVALIVGGFLIAHYIG